MTEAFARAGDQITCANCGALFYTIARDIYPLAVIDQKDVLLPNGQHPAFGEAVNADCACGGSCWRSTGLATRQFHFQDGTWRPESEAGQAKRVEL